MDVKVKDIGCFSFDMVHESVVRVFSPDTYLCRIDRALNEAEKQGLTHLVVYGDREHFANIHYFTGYDPRFEEGILILSRDREPILMVGNEGWNYADIIPYKIEKVLFQSLSLPGQPRSGNNSAVPHDTFISAGITQTSRVGVVGWKYFTEEDFVTPGQVFDVPHYLIAELGRLVPESRLVNATDIMIHPGYGLRTTVDIDEMAVLEVAGTKSSRSVYNVLKNLKPGMTEIEASANFHIDGDPLVSHVNLNFTPEAVKQGLVSPGNARLSRGGVCNIGFGYRSSMVARTALYVSGHRDLPSEWKDILEKVFSPYFKVMATWYESLRIGVTGKAVVENVKAQVPEFDALGIGLNLGHLIHDDEWTTSIFTEGAEYPIRNGMAIQCDIISVPEQLPGAHAEDGLIMADQTLRAAFAEKYPESWRRIERRREFMSKTLGIHISDEVLPLSDIQGCFFPWMGDLRWALSAF